MCDKSRIKFNVSFNLLLLVTNVCAISLNSGFSISLNKVSAYPRIPTKGVRNSWLILARKTDFRRFVSSAFSLAIINSFSTNFCFVISVNIPNEPWYLPPLSISGVADTSTQMFFPSFLRSFLSYTSAIPFFLFSILAECLGNSS